MSDKPKKRSRWVRNSGAPRYDGATEEYILSRYREADGWHRGAKVTKRAGP